MANSSKGRRQVWPRRLAWALLAYILLAFLVGTGEAVGFIFGLLPRERFVILPPVLTPSWGARQLLSLVLAVGLVGYLRGSLLMGRIAGAAAGLVASLQVISALAEWNRGSVTFPLSAVPYALLATCLAREPAQETTDRPPPRSA